MRLLPEGESEIEIDRWLIRFDLNYRFLVKQYERREQRKQRREAR